jgi:DNA-binding CsgD family transcriptional regulator
VSPLQNDKNIEGKESLFKRPAGVLLDEKQWLFLKDRYNMTPRELQVAILICRGFSNDDIAKALKIQHGTVKTHLRNIYRRTRVKSKILLLLRFVEDVNKYYSLPEASKPLIPITEIKTDASTPYKTVQKK